MTDTTYPSNSGNDRRPLILTAGAFLLLIVLGIVFLIPKLRHRESLKQEAAETGVSVPVRAVAVKLGASHSTLELPGTVQSFEQTPIYARTNGYVAKRLVDIGDRVRKGQLLAIIEDPTTEQALRQAQAVVLQMKAQLAQQLANAKLSTANNARWEQLYKEGVVSKLDADTRFASAGADDASVEAARANIAAAEANVRSLQEQKSFSQVTAPFTGVILSRSIDTGSLISSGSANSVVQMFTIGQSNRVRIFANVPQSIASSVAAAKNVKVEFRELPGEHFSGVVARTSTSIDPVSRTMLTEVDLDNPDGKILTGMYATTVFDTPVAIQPVMLPQTALIVRMAGPQTVVMDANHTAHFRSLVLGRDLGTEVEVIAGLKQGESVILSPSDAITEGSHVDPQTDAPPASASR